MKKILVWLLLLICLLCGCEFGTEVQEQTVEPSTETVTQPTEESVVLAGVNAHAFRASTERPDIAVFDERTAAFLTPAFASGDYARKQTCVQVFDLYTDTLETETVLDGTYEIVPHCAAYGHIALYCPQEEEILVLDENLQTVLTFSAEDPDGILTENMEYYYYIWGSELYCLEITSGTAAKVSMDQELLLDQVQGYDAVENSVLFSVYENLYTTDLAMGAVDLDTGVITLLHGGTAAGHVGENGFFLEQLHSEEMFSDVFYCDWSDPAVRKLPGFLVNDLDYNTWHVSGSDYICRMTYDAAQKVDIVDCQLFRMGETVSVCSLQDALNGAKLNEIHTLPDGNLLALAATRRGYQTYLICPDMLEFTAVEVAAEQGSQPVDLTLTEQTAPVQLPQELAQVRSMADALEENYGVTILISAQCAAPAAECDMPITTTDAAQMADEAQAIENALHELEAVLELYPEDFFRQFQNEAGERGLLVMLVEEISAELNVIGVTYSMGQWYPIAVDITSGEVTNTYCHEIWHATENRITDLDEGALDLVAWEACNPSDFFYSGNMTPSYIEDTRYTYFLGSPTEMVYFVDPYAKINSREDRARLMEYVMCSDRIGKDLMNYPPMRLKMLILCEAIREVFDTTQWGDVHWERFL